MRLTKLEKAISQLIDEGLTGKEIAARLNMGTSELCDAMTALNRKHQEQAAIEARKKDLVLQNSLLAPAIDGCKCQNLDRESPAYWLYTGYETNILDAAKHLLALGINARVKKNGNNGIFWLLVPSWVTGKLVPYAQPTWTTEEETGNVNYSTTNTAKQPNSTTREVFNTSINRAMENEREIYASVA